MTQNFLIDLVVVSGHVALIHIEDASHIKPQKETQEN